MIMVSFPGSGNAIWKLDKYTLQLGKMSFSIITNRIFCLPMISARRYLLPYSYLVFFGPILSPPLSETNLIWHIDKCVEHFGEIRSTRETNQVPWSAASSLPHLPRVLDGVVGAQGGPAQEPTSPLLLRPPTQSPGSRFQFFTNDRQAETGPTVNSGRYLSAKKSEEKFEGLSLQNWIEKRK